MTEGRYRVSVNGFWCHNKTWDDALDLDGKDDEVFVEVNTKVADSTGAITQNFDSESELMGDTWRLPGRVQAGSASDRGGIVTGDKFPTNTPWLRTGNLNTDRVPPYKIWEGTLSPGREVVFVTPTLWEYDVAPGFIDGWIEWHKRIDVEFGQRAKEIFTKIWPVSAPIFDAVSLGIQTVAKLPGLWSPFGRPMRRPVGLRRDPNDSDGALFNPFTIALSSETAAYLASSDLQGLGAGIIELRYADDPFLRGVYSLFLQVERLDVPAEWTDISHANDVVAMTSLDGRLYCVTGNNSLWMRSAFRRDTDWTNIGHANEVTALAASGGRLFCATRDNRLWSRDAGAVSVDWTEIGHANNVVAMTALDGRLFAATADNTLWTREPVLFNVNWTPIGQAPGIRALGSAPGSLYGLTATGVSRRDPVLADSPWVHVSDAPDARAIAVSDGYFYAATTGNRLIVHPIR
jgi:hypothetical protein